MSSRFLTRSRGDRGLVRLITPARAVVAVTLASVLVGAGAARGGTTTTTTTPVPSTLDMASDQAALTAYHNYLEALVSGTTLGRARDAALVLTLGQKCSNALTPLNSLPSNLLSNPPDSTALSNIGEEIGANLALAFLSEANKPFAQLSTTLGSLHWSTTTPALAITKLLASERAVLTLAQSHLCADARVVALSPRVTPLKTTTFLKRYLKASNAVTQSFHGFLTVLHHYETPAERTLVAGINQLVTQFGQDSTSIENTYTASVLQKLGLNS